MNRYIAALPLLLLCAACDSGPEVDHASSAACMVQTDGSFNTTPDGIAETTSINIFNAEGKIERIEFDTNGDGGMDEYLTYFYDDLGRNLRQERHHITGEELLGSEEKVFDNEGRVVLRAEDSNADGFVEYSEVTVYDEVGYRTTKTRYRPFDKSIETIETINFGELGIEKTLRQSPDNEFVEDELVLYSYEDGLLKTTEEYRGETRFSILEFRYDAAGLHTSSLFTRDEMTSLTTFSHDERGFVDGWVRDDNLDGTTDGSAVCAANDEGRMIFEEIDDDNDGSLDYAFYLSFDEEGRLTQDVEDLDGSDSDARRVINYRYECD